MKSYLEDVQAETGTGMVDMGTENGAQAWTETRGGGGGEGGGRGGDTSQGSRLSKLWALSMQAKTTQRLSGRSSGSGWQQAPNGKHRTLCEVYHK
jgi:hypothetical protein